MVGAAFSASEHCGRTCRGAGVGANDFWLAGAESLSATFSVAVKRLARSRHPASHRHVVLFIFHRHGGQSQHHAWTWYEHSAGQRIWDSDSFCARCRNGACVAKLFGYDFTADGWILPLFLGTALGISALPIIARILLDLNLLDKEIGSVILTSAVLNDLVGWAIFAVCLNLIRTDGVDANLPAVAGSILAALGLIWFGTMWLARPLLYVLKRSEFPGAFIIVACIFIFVAAALAEWFGIHPVFGAFLVGVVFAQFPKDDSDKQASEAIQK